MDLGLSGKVAIVTGSARGLGAATARRLAAGGREGGHHRHQRGAGAGHAPRRCKAEGLAAHCVVADITRRPTCSGWSTRPWRTFGAVHILVNNAGFPRDKYLRQKMSEDDWDLVDGCDAQGRVPRLQGGHAAHDRAGLGPHRQHQLAGPLRQSRAGQLLGGQGGPDRHGQGAGARGGTLRHHRQLRRARASSRPRWCRRCRPTRRSRSAPCRCNRSSASGKPDATSPTPWPSWRRERASFITGEVLHVTGGRFG